jgi:uncharacterized surface protein with fasciclin (FAS1) repeats
LNPIWAAFRNLHQKEPKAFSKKYNYGGIMNLIISGIFAAAMVVGVLNDSASAQMMGMKDENPMVGGAAMYKTKDIVDNAVNSADHTTLVAAVKAAGLVDTLKGKGPFTVFAPVNSAFEKLPAGTVEMLLKPENKAMLTKVLTYHVLAGNFDSKEIAKAIKKGNGKAEFTTVAGGKLWASMDGNNLLLWDEKGGRSTVTIADVRQSNGIIHVIDTVVLPE